MIEVGRDESHRAGGLLVLERGPPVRRTDVDNPVARSRARRGVAGQDDRDRAVALRVGEIVVVRGVPTVGTGVSVDLGEPREPMLAQVTAGAAHRLRGDAVELCVQLGVGEGDGGHHAGLAGADAVEERHPLDDRVGLGEAVQ